jgi:hypothetical protein
MTLKGEKSRTKRTASKYKNCEDAVSEADKGIKADRVS